MGGLGALYSGQWVALAWLRKRIMHQRVEWWLHHYIWVHKAIQKAEGHVCSGYRWKVAFLLLLICCIHLGISFSQLDNSNLCILLHGLVVIRISLADTPGHDRVLVHSSWSKALMAVIF